MSDTGTAAATTTTTTTDKPWFDGADADTIGFLQNRGLDKKPANDAAMALVKSYREAATHLGAPPDQLVRLPKDASDEAGRKAFYARIGVPTEAKDYDFASIKRADGNELDQAFRDSLGKAFLNNGVPKDAAPQIARDLVKYLDDQKAGDDTILQGKMQEEADQLAKNWGPNLKTNTFIANQAAEKLGLGKDVMDALTKVAGRPAVANALLKIGQMMGEDKFVANPAPGGSGAMTKDQAQSRINELMTDSDFGKRLESGDARANQEWNGLHRLLVA